MSTSPNYVMRALRGFVLGTAVLALTSPAFAQQGQAHRPRTDRAVEDAFRSGKDIAVIVRYKDAAAGERIKKQKSGKRQLRRELKGMRALSLRVNHRALRELLEDEAADVLSISYDAPVQGQQLLGLNLLQPTTTAVSISASGSAAARDRYGVTGAGVTVAVIDSGVKPHTDLPASRIKAFVDFVNGRTTAYDDYGHGTHVAGIVAGSGAASNRQYAGVAPNASIVALKVLDASGSGKTSDVIAALEWVLANHARYGIRVVNLSLGHPIYESATTDPLVQLVEQLSQRGIVVVASAGNSGKNALGQTVYGSVMSPANAQGAIAVGAADTAYTLARRDDTVASFSSRGPSRFDSYIKPDVLAPGYHIASLIATGSTLAMKYPSYQIGSSYFRLNGTSQAAPVVAGAAALLLQANPTLSAHAVKGVLQFTAQRLKYADVMSQGAGQVNIAGAVRLAKMINTSQVEGKRWVMTERRPVAADYLFGEAAFWGRAIIGGSVIKPGTNAMFVNSAMWNDNIVWGMLMFDNIVWGMMLEDNIVWGMLFNDNIVWGMLFNDNNIVWGMNDDNIVWGFDDTVSGLMFDNIVWGMNDNIIWGASDAVIGFSEDILGLSYEAIDGLSIQPEGEVR
jgi:serine protease AprX